MVTSKQIEQANKLRSEGYKNKEIAKMPDIKKSEAKANTKGGANTPYDVERYRHDYKKDKDSYYNDGDYADVASIIVPFICT